MQANPDEQTIRRGPVAVVFGSGGARGFAHLGVLQALEELGLTADIAVGTSIGSIAAAAYATGTVGTVREGASALGLVELTRMLLDPSLSTAGFLGGRRVMDRLNKWIPNVDIRVLRIPFAAVATDIAAMSETVLREGPILDAVRASISIPGVFRPVKTGDRWLVDGGLTNPLPVSVARDMGAARVLAVDINLVSGDGASGGAAHDNGSPALFDVITRTFRMGENAIERERLLRDRPDLLLQPAVGHVATLDFRDADAVMAVGYEAAMARRGELLALFGAA